MFAAGSVGSGVFIQWIGELFSDKCHKHSNSKIAKAAKDAIQSFAEGDEARMMLMGLKRFTKTQAFNPKAARQTIAQKLIADGKYDF